MLAELPVNRCGKHRHIGVRLVHGGQTFRAGQQADEADGLGVELFQPRHGGNRRVAGGQHRVHHHDIALVHVLGHFEVVLDGLQRRRVAVQTDMAHPRAGDHAEHPFQNAVARPQNRYQHQFFAVNDLAGHDLQRGFDLNVLQRHVARDFIGHQAAEFIEQGAKGVGRRVFAAHQRELVLHQRVRDEPGVGVGDRALHGCILQPGLPAVSSADRCGPGFVKKLTSKRSRVIPSTVRRACRNLRDGARPVTTISLPDTACS